MNSIASVPWWDADPMLSDLPETSLTPGQVLLICSIALLASTGLLVGSVRRGELSTASAFVVCTIGIAGTGAILHGLMLVPIVARGSQAVAGGDLESLVTGSTWVSALLGGFAVATLKPRDQVLRLLFSVFILLGTLMVAKALFERFVELPRTIALFERERESILLANGIEPDSPRAAIYERRLRSQQPTAWFGLANVLASYLGAMVLLLFVSVFRSFRESRRAEASGGAPGLLGLLLLGTAATLWFTGSLGAIGCTGLVLVAVLLASMSKPLLLWISGRPGTPVAAAGAVVLLGILVRALVLPESLERSVLFRWHYLVGTGRVWMENLLLGAGPGGFQDAYSRLKPPISPENVQSPHVLIADWIGAYGLLGILVMAGLAAWLWLASPIRSCSETEDDAGGQAPTHHFRSEFAWCTAVGAAVLATSLALQWGVVGGVADLLFVLAIGFGVGSGVVAVLLGVWHRHPGTLRWAALAGASVLMAHSMFDVTATRASSTMLFWLLMGAAVGPLRDTAALRRRWAILPVVVGLIPAGVIGWAGLRLTTQAEPLLAEAARAAGVGASELSLPGLSPEGAASEPPRTAGDLLTAAAPEAPSWLKLDLVRLRFEARIASSGGGRAGFDAAVFTVRSRWPDSVEAQSVMAASLWAFRGDPDHGLDDARAAALAAARAADLAPHDVQPAYRAAFMLQEVGSTQEALRYAQRVVRNLGQVRMDPLAGLSQSQILYINREFPGLLTDGFSDPENKSPGAADPL